MFATCSFLICIFINGIIQDVSNMFLWGERKLALGEGGGVSVLRVGFSCSSPPLLCMKYTVKPLNISGRHGMRNRAVEHNVVAFSELSFAVRWQGRLVLRITVVGNCK